MIAFDDVVAWIRGMTGEVMDGDSWYRPEAGVLLLRALEEVQGHAEDDGCPDCYVRLRLTDLLAEYQR